MVITEYANVKYQVIYMTEEIIKLFLVVEDEEKLKEYLNNMSKKEIINILAFALKNGYKYLKTLGIAKIYELLYNDKAF